mmetsp:Transcript_17919/g.32071  ORF Transcript_17919/g.32071 Transcript_17919/m.32071 type:complete len:275 (-) Transcript_17919:76-900(-)
MLFLLAIFSLAVFALLFAEIERLQQKNEVFKANLKDATSKKDAADLKICRLVFDKVISQLQLQQQDKAIDDLQLQLFESDAKLSTADYRIHLLKFHFVLEELELISEARRQVFVEDQPTPTKPKAAAGIDIDDDCQDTETEEEEEEEQASFEDLAQDFKQQDFSHIDAMLDSLDPALQQYWDLASGQSPAMADSDFFTMVEGAEDLPQFDDLKHLEDSEDEEEEYDEEEDEECEEEGEVQHVLRMIYMQPRIVGRPCSKFMAAQLHWAQNPEIA